MTTCGKTGESNASLQVEYGVGERRCNRNAALGEKRWENSPPPLRSVINQQSEPLAFFFADPPADGPDPRRPLRPTVEKARPLLGPELAAML